MTNLEIIAKVRYHFKEALTLLNEIDIDDRDNIEDIIDKFGSQKSDDGGIFSQLKYIKEDIKDEI